MEREHFFYMKLHVSEGKLCMYIVWNACGNASRWLNFVMECVFPCEIIFWVSMLIDIDFMKMPIGWTLVFGSCQYGLDFCEMV